MNQLQNGQLIEACLFMLDQEPRPHPAFDAPAIPINQVAQHPLVAESAVSSRQIASAIAPLAETLFPTPRIPTPRVLHGERWLVFEQSSGTTSVRPLIPKRQHKRNTLIGRPPSIAPAAAWPPIPKAAEQRGVRPLQLAPTRRLPVQPPLPSAPLRQSSSGELVQDLEIPLDGQEAAADQPKSAGRGKRSFLRPFLLKGKKKPEIDKKQLDTTLSKDQPTDNNPPATQQEVLFESQNPTGIDSEWTHVPRPSSTTPEPIYEPKPISRPKATRNDTVANILESYASEDASTMESPYEETAFISGSPPKPSPSRVSAMPVQVSFETLVEQSGLLPDHSEMNQHATRAQHPTISADDTTPKELPLVKSRSEADQPAPLFRHKASIPRDASQLTESPILNPGIVVEGTQTTADSPIVLSTEINSVTSKEHEPTVEESAITIGIKEEPDPLIPPTPLTSLPAESTSPISPATPSASPAKSHSPHNSSSKNQRHDPGDEKHRHHRSEKGTKDGKREKLDERKTRSRDKDQGYEHEEKRRARKMARGSREPEQQWLEVVFDGLPFGPNGTTLRALESLKTDWRIFLAELVALVGLAYVVQASGL